MVLLHSRPAAAITNKFHCCQFIFANMFRIHLRGTAETAILFVAAGIAQMPRFICYCATAFACVSHIVSPFLKVSCLDNLIHIELLESLLQIKKSQEGGSE